MTIRASSQDEHQDVECLVHMVDEEPGDGDADGRRDAVDAVAKRTTRLHRRLHQVEPKEAQEAEEAEEAANRTRDRRFRSWTTYQ